MVDKKKTMKILPRADFIQNKVHDCFVTLTLLLYTPHVASAAHLLHCTTLKIKQTYLNEKVVIFSKKVEHSKYTYLN